MELFLVKKTGKDEYSVFFKIEYARLYAVNTTNQVETILIEKPYIYRNNHVYKIPKNEGRKFESEYHFMQTYHLMEHTPYPDINVKIAQVKTAIYQARNTFEQKYQKTPLFEWVETHYE